MVNPGFIPDDIAPRISMIAAGAFGSQANSSSRDHCTRTGRPADAAAPVERALTLRAALARDQPAAPASWYDLAASHRLLGFWHETSARPREARS